MIYLSKLILIILIIISKTSFTEEVNKILFTINDKIFTTIDLNNRINYLELLTNDKINLPRNYLLDDYIKVLLFNEYGNKNNIKVDDKIIIEYINNIIKLYKKNNKKKFEELNNNLPLNENIIIKNIQYDYKRKLILENLLNKKNLNINKNEHEILNLYNIKIQYFTIEKNIKFDINEILKAIDFNNLEITNEYLENQKIIYSYFEHSINSLNKIDQKISNAILKNNNDFIIEDNEYFLIGKINKKIKENIETKYSFFQVFFQKDEEKTINTLSCENIKNNQKLKIKEFIDVEVYKLNEFLKENLKYVNDSVILENNQSKSYIILCEIKYNKNVSKQKLTDELINNEVTKITNEFVNQKKIEYNLNIYE